VRLSRPVHLGAARYERPAGAGRHARRGRGRARPSWAQFREAGFAVEKHAREGDPAQTTIDVADQQNADLMVIGARGTTGLRRFMLGSVAAKLSHHAPSRLLIVRDD
jgi:nucleotide-binding universal stress UspA family protein